MEFLFAAAPSPAETAAHSADAVGFQPQTHVVHIAAFLGEQLQRANQDLPQNPRTRALSRNSTSADEQVRWKVQLAFSKYVRSCFCVYMHMYNSKIVLHLYLLNKLQYMQIKDKQLTTSNWILYERKRTTFQLNAGIVGGLRMSLLEEHLYIPYESMISGGVWYEWG